MRSLRVGSRSILGVATAAAVLLAACSNGGGGSSSSAGGSGQATGGIVGTRSIDGIGKVLDDSKGFTLYHLTSETGGKIVCTASCASVWPPFLVSGSSAPASVSGASGTFGTVTRPDGSLQLTFNGMPLYTYSGDKSPGQANGNGIQGVWFAVTATGSGTSSGASSGSSSSGGGYGYG